MEGQSYRALGHPLNILFGKIDKILHRKERHVKVETT